MTVPTTSQVRNNFALGIALVDVWATVEDKVMVAGAQDVDWPVPGLREDYKAEFDAWFEQVKRIAYYDGFHAGELHAYGDD